MCATGRLPSRASWTAWQASWKPSPSQGRTLWRLLEFIPRARWNSSPATFSQTTHTGNVQHQFEMSARSTWFSRISLLYTVNMKCKTRLREIVYSKRSEASPLHELTRKKKRARMNRDEDMRNMWNK